MSLFSAYRFLLLTRCAPPTLVTTIKARGGVMIPAALAANAAAAAALASDAQVIALADESKLSSLDPAVLSVWKGRMVRSAWVSDSVRRGKLQDVQAYRIGQGEADPAAGASPAAAAAASAAITPADDSASPAAASSSRSEAAAAAASAAFALTSRPSPLGSTSIAALLGSVSGKRSRIDSDAPSQSQASESGAAAASAVPASSPSAKKPRVDPVVASVLRQHRRTSLEHKLQRFNQSPAAVLPAAAPSSSAREEIVIDSTPESNGEEDAAAIAGLSRDEQISAAVSSLVASGFSLPLIVHALLVTSGRFGLARHYLMHGSLPASETGWGPEDDGAIGSGSDAAIRVVLGRRGKDSVQRRVDFLQSVSAAREE